MPESYEKRDSINLPHTTIQYVTLAMVNGFVDHNEEYSLVGDSTELNVRNKKELAGFYTNVLPYMLLAWPPDLYAICGELMKRSGTYIDVAHHWPPYDTDNLISDYEGIFSQEELKRVDANSFLKKWTERIQRIAMAWRLVLDINCYNLPLRLRNARAGCPPSEKDVYGDALREHLGDERSPQFSWIKNCFSGPKFNIEHVDELKLKNPRTSEQEVMDWKRFLDVEFKYARRAVNYYKIGGEDLPKRSPIDVASPSYESAINELRNCLTVVRRLYDAVFLEGKQLQLSYLSGRGDIDARIEELKKDRGCSGDTQANRTRMLDDYKTARKVSWALVECAILADEACSGIGFRNTYRVRPEYLDRERTSSASSFLDQHSTFLESGKVILDSLSNDNKSATLLARIRARNTIVLPKAHTPTTSTSLRALTHHLALIRGGEVIPNWHPLQLFETRHYQKSLTLLLIPYPFAVAPSQFKSVSNKKSIRQYYAGRTEYFTYKPRTSQEDIEQFIALIRKAKQKVGIVDGVVLPEMAWTAKDHPILCKKLLMGDLAGGDDPRFVLCGVVGESGYRDPRKKKKFKRLSENKAIFTFELRKRSGKDSNLFDQQLTKEQFKHHRWHLNDSQIRQYGIGAQLHPSTTWAEYTEIPRREQEFFVLNERLVVATLICEDLAQSDPIGDVIRSVGPALVICLLADGPQLKHRWSAKAATGLADDPGSSVLTLTSLGFSQLSRPIHGENRRQRVIALWKDQVTGTHEIELPANASAAVINLSLETTGQSTLDGRIDASHKVVPTLSGVHMI